MIRDGQVICDSCQTAITRLTVSPAEDWARMHNLCSKCFGELRKQSVSRA